jgi:hypothetical protein
LTPASHRMLGRLNAYALRHERAKSGIGKSVVEAW